MVNPDPRRLLVFRPFIPLVIRIGVAEIQAVSFPLKHVPDTHQPFQSVAIG